MNRQPPLLPDADQVVECHGRELYDVLARAEADGRHATALKVVGQSGWRVTLRKMPASDTCPDVGSSV